MTPLDYGRSFIQGTLPANRVRFWVESRTRIVDEREGRTEDFYQCGACKAEETFAEKDLLRGGDSAYDFLPVFGPHYSVIYRRPAAAPANTDYRQVAPSDSWWGELLYRIKEAVPADVLETNEQIRQATHAGRPIVVQTELWNDETALRAIIEHPAKTINIHDGKNMYQTDSGPLAFPDLSRRYDRMVESLSLAFEAINASHFADFLIEVRTPVSVADRRACDVYHYSKAMSFSAKNTLYGVGDQEGR